MNSLKKERKKNKLKNINLSLVPNSRPLSAVVTSFLTRPSFPAYGAEAVAGVTGGHPAMS